MRLVAAGQLDASRFVTHHLGMNEFEQGYGIFGEADNGALKVVLAREEEADE
jgi:alcohol dehydrogenase